MRMSPQEQDQITGATMTELRQARAALACLEYKAHNMARDITLVGQVIKGEIKGSCLSGYFIVEPPSERPKRIEWPTIQDMNGTIMERERLREEITRLEGLANQMGLTERT